MRKLLRLALAVAIVGSATQANAAWYEAKSKHFIIDGDVDPQELTDYAKKLERFDQAVRIARDMPDPSLTDAGRLRIYFLRNLNEWADLTGAGGLLGEYSANASGSYAFVFKLKADQVGDFNSDLLFFHEYAHHMMFQNWAAALPTWVAEGFAEFFSTAKVSDDGSVVLGGPANQRSIGIYALHHEYSLTDMLNDSERRMTGWKMELIYSRGWLLTHYLTFDQSRRGQLDKYIAGIQNGESGRDSALAAFGDLGTLENELNHYADQKQIPGIVIKTDPKKLGPISVNPLPAAQSALMPVKLRLDFGISSSNTRMVAADARRLAAYYPTDPFALTVLSEAEYSAEHYDAAKAAADRAVAADPNDVHALIAKGRAEMQIARSDPASANWAEIRSSFAKANHLDTENAEPLMLYYESFAAAGQRPSDSAVKGLMYALILAPSDQNLRWMAVGQEILDGKPDEAKRTLVPIVYDPHVDATKDVAEKVLAAIESGDLKAGLATIDKVEKDWKQY